MPEKGSDDAPAWFTLEEAPVWASGYNQALDDLDRDAAKDAKEMERAAHVQRVVRPLDGAL